MYGSCAKLSNQAQERPGQPRVHTGTCYRRAICLVPHHANVCWNQPTYYLALLHLLLRHATLTAVRHGADSGGKGLARHAAPAVGGGGARAVGRGQGFACGLRGAALRRERPRAAAR